VPPFRWGRRDLRKGVRLIADVKVGVDLRRGPRIGVPQDLLRDLGHDAVLGEQ